jgi:hypothetical protein
VRYERNASVVTPEYINTVLAQYPLRRNRTGTEILSDLQARYESIFGGDGQWFVPTLLERFALAERSRSADDILQHIDDQFTPVLADVVNSPASATDRWAYVEQRLQDIAHRLERELQAVLKTQNPFMYQQAMQRLTLYRQRLQTARLAAENDHHRLRDLLSDFAIRMYTYYAMAPPSNDTAAALFNCATGSAASALSCALQAVQATPAATANPALRGEVVDDLLFTDRIFQHYELHRDAKDLLVSRTTYTHFLRTMSMLLDAGYAQEEAAQLIFNALDDLQANLEADNSAADGLVADLKAEFRRDLVHFPTRPKVEFNFPPPAPGKKSRWKSLVRTVASVAVGAAISVFMPGAVPAVLPNLGALGTAMLTGATAGAASGLINKEQRLEHVVLRGALLAGAANVIGDALPFATSTTGATEAANQGAFSLSDAAARVVAEGAVGCAVSEMTGGRCKHGLIQGAVGEVAASARVALGVESRVLSAALVGSASATSAWAVGGRWEEGFLHGVLIDQFNHAMHDLKTALESSPPGQQPALQADELVIDVGKELHGDEGQLFALAKDGSKVS